MAPPRKPVAIHYCPIQRGDNVPVPALLRLARGTIGKEAHPYRNNVLAIARNAPAHPVNGPPHPERNLTAPVSSRGIYCRFVMAPRRLQCTPRTVIAHALLALTLLVAQSLAQAHVYSHLRSGVPARDLGSAAVQLCSQCLSGAPLLSAVSSPVTAQVSFGPVSTSCEDAAVPVRVEISRHYAFRSRAPPVTF